MLQIINFLNNFYNKYLTLMCTLHITWITFSIEIVLFFFLTPYYRYNQGWLQGYSRNPS